MDASNASDPTNDSQATQMIQDLLENSDSSSWKLSETRGPALMPQAIHSNEISSDSLPSSRTSNSLPQYHFHGLASTQTQSQHHGEDEEVNEGSQKENIASLKSNKDAGQLNPSSISRPPSPHASSSRNVQTKTTNPDTRNGSPSTGKNTANKPVAAVSFQIRSKHGAGTSPSKPVARQTPYKIQTTSRYKQPARPPSRTSSQDSFAADPSDDPQELFLAKSKLFAIPISELARNSSPTRDPRQATGGAFNAMFAYSSPSRQPRTPSSPPQGKILVEATPSQSGSSQSVTDPSQHLSHQFEATQLADEPVVQNRPAVVMAVDKDKNGDGSGYESSEPTSSFGRFLDGERDPEPEMQATQPSTQPDDSHMSTVDVGPSTRGGWSTNPSAATGISTNNPQSGPRSLVKMVRPENQWRYQKYNQPQQIMPSIQSFKQPQFNPSLRSHIPSSSGQETQPSFPDQMVAILPHSSNLPHVPSNMTPTRGFSKRVSPHVASPGLIDSMDVIPDSEPLRPELDFSSPKRPLTSKLISRSPPKGRKDNVRTTAHEDVDMAEPLAAPQQEEEEEDEDDIPLAATTRGKGRFLPKRVDKGKGKAVQRTSVETTTDAERTAKGKIFQNPGIRGKIEQLAPMKQIQKLVAIPGPSKTGRSWETGEVPSSVPEQDIIRHTRNTRNLPTKKDVKQNNQSRHTSRSTSDAPRSRGQRVPSYAEESDDELLMQHSDKDDTTEPAEEEYQDDLADGPPRKRKRAPIKSEVPNAKAGTKRSKRTNATPATRQAKRLRSAVTSTATRVMNQPASRVFALWKSDGHYYSGLVYSADTNSRYLIKFDDGTEGAVNLDQMRLCEPRVGDDVLVANRTRGSKVVSVDDFDNGHISVDIDDSVVEVQVSDVRIAHKTISSAWKDRILTRDTVVTVVKPIKVRLSPSPSKMSMVSLPSVRGGRKKVLAKTGLIITLSAANGNWEEEKGIVMNDVKNCGGFVIDDLFTVVKMDGRHSMNNNRWVIEKSDVQWIGSDDIERLFLLADDPNQKPKYLMALALGIPCLSTTWLHESVDSGEEKDWLHHMLPQGYSAILGARPSQQVDVDWGNSVHQLKDIISNAVASKLFTEKSILCVGQEMVPQPKGRRRIGVDEKSQEAINAVTRIILSMGADRVEAVTELRFASRDLTHYDFLVIRGVENYSSEFAECTTVHWTWVKDCLIASRYLPLPEWPTEHSQEA
ncbi:hypothetical protein B0H34DRAFT_764888 [Crassisporium funariophilum]|nr:hypothetical protein B0H34DRAFT_764888 [Crassisporium funariophilum]